MKYKQIIPLLFAAVLFNTMVVYAEDNSMSFFVTSTGSGKGGDL